MELFPNEYYQLRKEAIRRGTTGTLGLTNLRVVWMEGGVPSLYFAYSQINEVEVQDAKKDDTSIMQLIVVNPGGGLRNEYFGFKGLTRGEDSEVSKNLINSYKRQSALGGGVVLVPDSVKKQVTALSRDNVLAQLHKALVQEGDMTEEEFWQLQPLLSPEEQVAGRIPAVFQLPHRQGEGHRVVVDFNSGLKSQLFRQFPELRSWFNREVPHMKSEREFWKSFCELQAQNGFQDITVPNESQDFTAPHLIEEEAPLEIGCHKLETPSDRSTFLMSKFNKHSARIVSQAHLAPDSPVPPHLKLSGYSFPEPMQLDVHTLTSDDRKTKILDVIKSANPNALFPSSFESEERIKYILRLSYQSQYNVSRTEQRLSNIESTKKFYELLRYFYSLFPVDSTSDLRRLQVVLKLLQDYYEEKVTVNCDVATANQLMHSLTAAEDKVEQAKAFFDRLRDTQLT